MEIPVAKPMDVTLEANHILNAGIRTEGLAGFDVRATYSTTPGADGEINVYQGPDRVVVTSEVVEKTSVPAKVAERILEQIRVANPAVSAGVPSAPVFRDAEPDADIAVDAEDPRG